MEEKANTPKKEIDLGIVVKLVKDFLESKPLYVKVKTDLPGYFSLAMPNVLELYCKTCKTSRPFKKPVFSFPVGGSNNSSPQNVTEIKRIIFVCTGCSNSSVIFFVFVNYEGENFVMKVGQFPMWLPIISKELKDAFGGDVELYEKALRNMNEGYGIGACAYLRRLVEKYINPLLELLHDVKQEQGESQDKLDEIKEVIKAKDFTSKTKYAAEIAPSVVIVQGHNPLKEIHERLSIGLHSLDDDKAIEYATVIKSALEFIIPRLRREYDERKEYAKMLKTIRNLPT